MHLPIPAEPYPAKHMQEKCVHILPQEPDHRPKDLHPRLCRSQDQYALRSRKLETNSYRRIPCIFQDEAKVAPKVLDFASLNHHPKSFIGELRFPSLGPAASHEDLVIVQDPFEFQVA